MVATIRAALHLFQRIDTKHGTIPKAVMDVATENDTIDRLDREEIEELCERLKRLK